MLPWKKGDEKSATPESLPFPLPPYQSGVLSKAAEQGAPVGIVPPRPPLPGLVPDIVTFAKGVNGAYLPLGGVAVRDKIADHFRKHPSTGYGSTYDRRIPP